MKLDTLFAAENNKSEIATKNKKYRTKTKWNYRKECEERNGRTQETRIKLTSIKAETGMQYATAQKMEKGKATTKR